MASERLRAKLRALYESGDISESEYHQLLSGRKKLTRKQRQTALRNLRRACRSLDRKMSSRPKSKAKTKTKLERDVLSLRSEVREMSRKEELRLERDFLRKRRRDLRDAIRRGDENAFLLGRNFRVEE